MSLPFNKFPLLLAPPDNTGGVPPDTTKELTVDGIMDILGEETNEVIDLDEDKGSKKSKENKEKENEEVEETDKERTEEESEEIDELEELEQELEGPDEEQLELTTPVRRKEILAKYPSLFKDFPYLEKAYYREQQFTEIYPTIDDARAASEKAQQLDTFEQRIMSGSTEDILKAVKAEDESAFHKVVDNYLLALHNTDQTAYHHVIGNMVKSTIANMVTEGKRIQNDALIQAAAILNQFVFGTAEYTPPGRLSKQNTNDPEKENVNKERQELVRERFEGARDDLQTRLSNSLKATIEQNIDKNQSMTDYVRRNASREAMETLERLINGDTRFQNLKDKLWAKAFEENFSKASLDRIRSAYVSKAKVLLPAVIKKARNEALRGLGKRVKDDTEQETTQQDGGKPPRNRETTPSSRNSGRTFADKAKQIPRGMSTVDYFMQD